MNSKVLGRQNLRDQLVERICDLIAGKELLPGQTLPTEKELQAQYGVSHTVVRGAS
ncbi:MAG: GntR family transcriptional regulator, partial [Chloroflexota bacterium]